jgi:acyl-CoA dehydrogenase
MSTVGHPLSDICNFLTNFFTAQQASAAQRTNPGATTAFLPGQTPGLPTSGEIVQWYAETSGYDPRSELNWGMAFSIFKLAAVCQGIAARFAVRQASSEKAKQHADARFPMAEFAWTLAKDAKKGEAPKL